MAWWQRVAADAAAGIVVRPRSTEAHVDDLDDVGVGEHPVDTAQHRAERRGVVAKDLDRPQACAGCHTNDPDPVVEGTHHTRDFGPMTANNVRRVVEVPANANRAPT